MMMMMRKETTIRQYVINSCPIFPFSVSISNIVSEDRFDPKLIYTGPPFDPLPMMSILQMNLEIFDRHARSRRVKFSRTVITSNPR